MRATTLEEQKKIAAEIQKEAYDQVIYIPLGQYRPAERLADIADRRARRPGDADLLEYRQEGVGAGATLHADRISTRCHALLRARR